LRTTLPESKLAEAGLVHTSITLRIGELTLRDAVPSEAGLFVRYWQFSGEQHLKFLGIDRKKLGTVEDTRNRFLKMIRTPAIDQSRVVFTIALHGEAVGYTNVNRYGPDENYPHLHLYRQSLRSAIARKACRTRAKSGAGPAAALIGPIMKLLFDLFPLRRVVLQTRTRNLGINRALDFYLPPAETRFFANPDGIAGEGEFHMRYVHRDDVPWMVARASELVQEECK